MHSRPAEQTSNKVLHYKIVHLLPTSWQGFTSLPLLASIARWTTSSKFGKAFFSSFENTTTPLIATSKDNLRPTVPSTVAFGTLERICRFSSSKRGAYPHPPQYSTATITGVVPAILADQQLQLLRRRLRTSDRSSDCSNLELDANGTQTATAADRSDENSTLERECVR